MRHNLIKYGNDESRDWLIGLTKRRSVGHQYVDAFRDQVPFIQQRLTSRQVESPAVEPRSPAGEGERGERKSERERGERMRQRKEESTLASLWRPDSSKILAHSKNDLKNIFKLFNSCFFFACNF